MNLHLSVRNRQQTRPINRLPLRHFVRALVADLCPEGSHTLGVHLVDAEEMTRLNERFLGHRGSTDVITFDYIDPDDPHPASPARAPHHPTPSPVLHGDIFICVDQAVQHARQFRTTWPSELARYILHGLLHLLGYDDRHPAARRRMKREENRRLRAMGRRFALSTLAPPATL